jgi:hypothetical protein
MNECKAHRMVEDRRAVGGRGSEEHRKESREKKKACT